MLTREDHIEEARRVFNHIGISSDTEIGRCIGFAEDDSDYYWIISFPGDRGVTYCSKVGPFVSLKDLNYPRYEYLDKAMDEYWGVFKEDSFIIRDITGK